MQDQTLIVPLVALAWPETSALELSQLYEALTFLLVEDYDVLILCSEIRVPNIRAQLETLGLPEDTIHFLPFESSRLSIANGYRLIVAQNQDGSEFVDLTPIEPAHQLANVDVQSKASNIEFISCEHKIFVPIYDKEIQDEMVMAISQRFSSQEVIALDCEILNPLQLKLSDLILFAND